MSIRASTLALLLMPSMVAAQDVKGDAFVLQACFDADTEAFVLAEGVRHSMDKVAFSAQYQKYSRLVQFLHVAGGPLTRASLSDKQGALALIESNGLACQREAAECDRSEKFMIGLAISPLGIDCANDFRGN